MIHYAPVKLLVGRPVIETFLLAQWAETGDPDLECKPNWQVYDALETSRSLLLLLAYDNVRPIGYLAAFIHPHINSCEARVATISTYFVEQRPARSLILFRMLQEAVRRLSASLVVHINLEVHADYAGLGGLTARLGFQPAKIGYKLRLSQGVVSCPISASRNLAS